MSGYTESLGFGHMMGNDSSNIFLMKTDTSGNLKWMEVYGDGLQDESFRAALDNDGGYLIPGFTTNYVFNDSTQMVIIKTDSAGYTGCHEVRVEPRDSFVVIPFANLSLNELSGISTGTLSLTTTNFTPDNENACMYTSLNKDPDNRELNVYPNPFNESITIEASEKNSGGEIIIADILGKTVFSGKINFDTGIIQTANLEKGIYYVSIKRTDGLVTTKKLLKF